MLGCRRLKQNETKQNKAHFQWGERASIFNLVTLMTLSALLAGNEYRVGEGEREAAAQALI